MGVEGERKYEAALSVTSWEERINFKSVNVNVLLVIELAWL